MAKKASVKISGLGEAKANALKFLNESKKDAGFLNTIGKLSAEQIKMRTRAGLEEYKQDPLTDYTQKRRESLIKSGNAFDNKIVKAKRSNLSLSGQLLEAVKHRVNGSLSEITLFISSKRDAYRGKFKDRLENKKNNNEIKDELESLGREFFFLSDKLKAQLESKITQELRRKLALFNKIKRQLRL